MIRRSVILLSFFAVANCRQRTEDSNPKYGFLKHSVSETSLLWVKPGERIEVCGVRAREVYDGLVQWMKALGRASKLTVTQHSECTPANIAGAQALVRSFNFDGADDPFGLCGQELGAYTDDASPHRRLSGVTRGADIIFCHDPRPGTALHEVGHVMGMCDQYSNSNPVAMHPNCQDEMKSERAVTSIMNNTDYTSLLPDDLLGIRILACRRGFEERPWFDPGNILGTATKINEKWADQVGSTMNLWNLGDLGKEMDRLNTLLGGQHFLGKCVSAVTDWRKPVCVDKTSQIWGPCLQDPNGGFLKEFCINLPANQTRSFVYFLAGYQEFFELKRRIFDLVA
jgi:hypothetical protein